jgi:hypothetical protein
LSETENRICYCVVAERDIVRKKERERERESGEILCLLRGDLHGVVFVGVVIIL